MTSPLHLLYVSDVVPGAGFGGRIVIDRHLRRLAEEGWRITLLSSFATGAAPGPWREIRLPARRWWWLPFRPERALLVRFRTWACRRELARGRMPKPDAVMTICWGSMSLLAATLAQSCEAPLTALVHDWWHELDGANAISGRTACRKARHVFAVSREMQAALTAECGRAIDLLYPLPEARSEPFVEWRADYRRPIVAHVGSLHPYHERFLAGVADRLQAADGQLLLLAGNENPVAAALAHRGRHVVRQDPFPENAAALRWIAAHVSGLVIMYPHGSRKTGHPPTGFPSRFVEFAQTGLPILLAAPPGNPIRSWAREHNWTSACDPEETAAMDTWIRDIARPATWEMLARQTRQAANTDFDPAAIHRKLARALAPSARDFAAL